MGKKDTVRVIIVDDHSVVRDGVEQILDKAESIELRGKAASADEAIKLLSMQDLDLVITDITLSGSTSGIDLIKAIRERFPQVKLLVMSMHDESIYGERVIRAGASGYVMKEDASLKMVDAIRTVMSGDLYLSEGLQKKIVSKLTSSVDKVGNPVEMLTNREFEVFRLIGNGYSTREIGERLNVSVNTVESHRNKIKAKMKLKSSAELVKHAIQWVISSSK